ncbi:MAG: terminase small subunit [Eubacteriaceae bacterium]
MYLNAIEAAIRAGYLKKTAKVMGPQNLEKFNIQEYISKKLEEIQSEKTADAQELMKPLTAVMRRDKMSLSW